MLESVLKTFNSQLLGITDGDENNAAAEPPSEGNNRVGLLTDKLELKNTKSVQKVRAFTNRLRGETTTTTTRNTIARKVKSPLITTNVATLPPPPPQCSPNSRTPRSPKMLSEDFDDVSPRSPPETKD
ncbi:hypothetical protein ACFFRR_002334, partial [Megaselia abdita]